MKICKKKQDFKSPSITEKKQRSRRNTLKDEKCDQGRLNILRRERRILRIAMQRTRRNSVVFRENSLMLRGRGNILGVLRLRPPSFVGQAGSELVTFLMLFGICTRITGFLQVLRAKMQTWKR